MCVHMCVCVCVNKTNRYALSILSIVVTNNAALGFEPTRTINLRSCILRQDLSAYTVNCVKSLKALPSL